MIWRAKKSKNGTIDVTFPQVIVPVFNDAIQAHFIGDLRNSKPFEINVFSNRNTTVKAIGHVLAMDYLNPQRTIQNIGYVLILFMSKSSHELGNELHFQFIPSGMKSMVDAFQIGISFFYKAQKRGFGIIILG